MIGKDFSEDTDQKKLLEYLIWTSKYPMMPHEVFPYQQAHPEIYEDPKYVPLYENFKK